MKEISRVNGVPGDDINISISKNLQNFCYERLGDNSGSIVVLDVRNGEILSMVSKTIFLTQNDFITNMSQKKWNKIIIMNLILCLIVPA